MFFIQYCFSGNFALCIFDTIHKVAEKYENGKTEVMTAGAHIYFHNSDNGNNRKILWHFFACRNSFAFISKLCVHVIKRTRNMQQMTNIEKRSSVERHISSTQPDCNARNTTMPVGRGQHLHVLLY